MKAYKKIRAKFADRGMPLSAGFGLEMPHNAVGLVNLSAMDIEKKLAVSEAKLPKIIQLIENKVLGDFMTTKALSLIADGTFFKMLPSVLPLFKALIVDGAESLRFVADESCSHCGICERICPKDNICLVQGKPVGAWALYPSTSKCGGTD